MLMNPSHAADPKRKFGPFLIPADYPHPIAKAGWICRDCNKPVEKLVVQIPVGITTAYAQIRTRVDPNHVQGRTAPTAEDIPAGHVLVHNNVWHTTRTPHGIRGFRGWFQKLSDKLEPCECGWAGLPHYRVAGLNHWPTPAPAPGSKAPTNRSLRSSPFID